MEREGLEPGAKILVLRNSYPFVGATHERVLIIDYGGAGVRARIRFGAGMSDEWVLLADEGVTWCRGWDNPEALVAACALAQSASE